MPPHGRTDAPPNGQRDGQPERRAVGRADACASRGRGQAASTAPGGASVCVFQSVLSSGAREAAFRAVPNRIIVRPVLTRPPPALLVAAQPCKSQCGQPVKTAGGANKSSQGAPEKLARGRACCFPERTAAALAEAVAAHRCMLLRQTRPRRSAAPQTTTLTGCCLQLCGCFGAAPAHGRRSTSLPRPPLAQTQPGCTSVHRLPTSHRAACTPRLARGKASAPACSTAAAPVVSHLRHAREHSAHTRTASKAK